jgi:hypothetical protein
MSDPAKSGADKAPETKPDNQPPKGDSSKDAKSGADKAPEPRQKYHVVGPGSVTFGGKAYQARSKIELTDAEAEDLGEAVKLGPPPKIVTPEEIASRTAGKYKVVGPGTLWHGGKLRNPGYEFDADQDEARSLGATIVRV